MCSALLNTGVPALTNPTMSSSFILMYSHLNLDDIYDLMMEEEIMTAEISEHDAFISHSKIYNQFPDDKKEPSNHAKVSKKCHFL